MKIEISKDDLHDILHEYDEDNYEAKPLGAKSFVDYIFNKYMSVKDKLLACGAYKSIDDAK